MMLCDQGHSLFLWAMEWNLVNLPNMTVIKLPLALFMQPYVRRAWLPEGFCSLIERLKIHLCPSPASCPRPRMKAEVRDFSAYCLLASPGEEPMLSVVDF